MVVVRIDRLESVNLQKPEQTIFLKLIGVAVLLLTSCYSVVIN